MGLPGDTPEATSLLTAMVGVVDTLVDDFDIVEAATRLTESCVSVLAVDAAGLILANGSGGLQVMASTTEDTHRLEIYQILVGEGPCLDAFHSGRPIAEPQLADSDRWPRFISAALDLGYRAVYALPLELRGYVIGAMNLFATTPGSLSDHDQQAAQVLTHMTTVAVLQSRTLHEARQLNDRLQQALASRIIVEQAKSRLAERGRLDTVDDAFALLRAYARRTNQRLSEIAGAIMNNTFDLALILTPTPPPQTDPRS
ncbi:GAF and ANTAR domain-containing protein [Pseudonocardia cypriaca]|uniref:GAF domain-containing protein n=1 Tax=Pseudonocardia cypriaca TaxID=882449 RepID=A0A543FNG0_9PSEU|nr:GAF and ANTAR domain-containing protein [Pseudonocardia cypriaca]TQM35352.1 GAF domain-containing protein [Pseudonocardia cypriaca]